MPRHHDILSILGPLAGILPRVFAVMAAGVAAVVCAHAASQALREGGQARFLGAGLAGIVAVLAGWLVLASLSAYGIGDAGPDPLGWDGVVALLRSLWPLVAAAVVAGTATATFFSWRPRDDVSAEAMLAEPHKPRGKRLGRTDRAETALGNSREQRAKRVGALGELLVASALAELGWWTLHNIVLAERGRTVEIDHLVRAPAGILVLETKTYSGLAFGGEHAATWTRTRSSGEDGGDLLNPVLQNAGHVRAVERFIDDPRVSVRGFVVSAGRARFDAAAEQFVVPVARLRAVLLEHAGVDLGEQARIAVAWRRLEAEAPYSQSRRESHVAYVRRRWAG